ncbi:MAG: SCO family protein [Rhodovarius sp.]|nr:SCO family protein [Rhodovarius sp.]
MLKAIRYTVFALLLLLAGLWSWAWLARGPGQSLGESFADRLALLFGRQLAAPSAGGGLQLPAGLTLGGPFSLIRHDGQPVTERDYAGRWLLIYFGFTYCPDVCPTELGRIADVLDELGPLGEQVTPLLITIDPQRDTPAALADYVSRFHPRMQGLTGSPAQIAEVARRYRVYYARVQHPDMTDYTMDHSAFVYLVGPDARVRLLFRPETPVEEMARAIRQQLRVVTSP